MSATTTDLGPCREVVKNVLLQAGIYPIIQDHFGPDARTLTKLVHDKIVSSDAVICLIGHAFGIPCPSAAGDLKSYTQLEFDLACRFEKQLFLFVATDSFAQDLATGEPSDRQENQQQYRSAILAGTRGYDWFSSTEELERQIYGVIEPVRLRSNKRDLIYEHAPPRPAAFVGREREIEQLNDAVDARLPCVIAVIGMAGQGKTTLVAQTLRAREHLPFVQGLWVSAYQGGYTFGHFLDTALAHFLGGEFDKSQLASVEARTRRLVKLLQERSTLIVIDGIERWLAGWQKGEGAHPFDQPESRSGAFEGVDGFLAATTGLENGSHVIITSRALPAALDLLGCAFVPVMSDRERDSVLAGLTPEASVELLGSLGVVAPPDKLQAVARQLAHHPFALTSFARIANRLGRHWEDLHALKDPSRTVHALLDELCRHLPDPEQSCDLLKHAAIFLEDVPVVALAWLSQWDRPDGEIQSEAAMAQQVITLAAWNVLSWNSENLTVNMHSLVKNYFEQLFTAEEIRLTHARIATWYRAQKWNADAVSLDHAKWLFLCVKHALLAGQVSRAVAVVFDQRGTLPSLYDWLVSRGHLWESAELISEIAERTVGLTRAHCLLAKFNVLQRLDLLSRARNELDEATEWLETALSAGDPEAVQGLAKCYAFKGNLSLDTERAIVARDLYDRAITLFERAPALDSAALLDLSSAISNRGLANWSMGDWGAAEADFRQAMNLIKHLQEPDGFPADPLGFEILIKRSFVCLDADQPQRALQALVPAAGALRDRYLRTAALWDRVFALWLVAMAASHKLAGDTPAALAVGSEAVELLSGWERLGRLGFRAMLAAALVDRGEARMRLGETEGALEDVTRAVQLYLEKVNEGAAQFEGQLANALFYRAQIYFQLQHTEAAGSDLDRGMSITERWIEEWFYDCNIGNVALDHFLTFLFSLEMTPNWSRRFLWAVRLIRDRANVASVDSAAIIRIKERLGLQWEQLSNAARSLDLEWPVDYTCDDEPSRQGGSIPWQ